MSDNEVTTADLDSLVKDLTARKCQIDEFEAWAKQAATAVKIAKAEMESMRAAVLALLEKPGRSWTAYNDSDVEIATVSIPRPSKRAEVVDEDAFIGWVREQHISELDRPLRLREGVSWEQVAEALFEFDEGLASEFLERVDVVNPAWRADTLKKVVAGREVPGVKAMTSEPYVRIAPTAFAKQCAADVFARTRPEEILGLAGAE